MTDILTAKNIFKTFENEIRVLKGVELTVRERDFISILGASGSGKSTLLTILGGMDKADEGEVLFHGTDLGQMKEKELAALRRTRVGFVFQFFNLAPYLTVEENIFLPLILDGKSIKQFRDKFAELTAYLKIEHIINKMPGKLSGGEQQRTAIARALIYDPEIIFLDEPTGNLDSVSADEIMRLLQRINREKGTTVIQVTHSETNASFGNRMVRISDGMIVEDVILPTSVENVIEKNTTEDSGQEAVNIDDTILKVDSVPDKNAIKTDGAETVVNGTEFHENTAESDKIKSRSVVDEDKEDGEQRRKGTDER